MKILVINPGSTSTKVSLFEDRINLFTQSQFHDAPLLLSFKSTNAQLEFRTRVTLSILNSEGYDIDDVDIFVGRGGSAHTVKGGLILIDDVLYQDTVRNVGHSDHPAKLGVMIAYNLAKEHGKKAYTLNPTNVDELEDVARITGIKGMYRKAQSHALNQKAVASLEAKRMGKRIEDTSFVVAHIDGGISIGAHRGGRMIDSVGGASGEGPFTPTRIGTIPAKGLLLYLQGRTYSDIEAMCSESGGFVSYFGTSDAGKVYEMVEKGDRKASLIWEAMLYQTVKAIGEMACVLSGRVDAVILTGGLVRYPSLVQYITEHVSFIAPVVTYPGEVEQEAMAEAVCDYIEGKIEVNKYIPEDVFESFEWDSTVYGY